MKSGLLVGVGCLGMRSEVLNYVIEGLRNRGVVIQVSKERVE